MIDERTKVCLRKEFPSSTAGLTNVYRNTPRKIALLNERVQKSSHGLYKVVHEDRSGRPVLIATKSREQQVEELIRVDRRGTIDSIATAIGCSHGLTYSIMPDR
ncbi:hypothetical protein TNCT_520891 [Trichonephila clavata]|uniref:Uncharacterized protein n=1 Tax=Trichonephila clavata TaxID=2740835 RepID=A0A8X6HJ33_TRICU|nr:hypothetical protein TNCT_520891 [Trichonephila clavata]